MRTGFQSKILTYMSYGIPTILSINSFINTSFRKNKESFESQNADGKYELMIENSSMVKRPILEKDGKVIAMGFDEDTYKKFK